MSFFQFRSPRIANPLANPPESGETTEQLYPTGVDTGEVFGSPTLTAGAVTVAPTGISSAEAFGTTAVNPGAVTVAPTGIATAEAFGAATVNPGAVDLAPAGIAAAEAFGEPAMTRPIGELIDEFTGPDIDLTRWHLVGV